MSENELKEELLSSNQLNDVSGGKDAAVGDPNYQMIVGMLENLTSKHKDDIEGFITQVRSMTPFYNYSDDGIKAIYNIYWKNHS